MLLKTKKSIVGPIISVFVLILVVSILAGLTFLFVASLKTQVIQATDTYLVTYNESGAWANASGYPLAQRNLVGFSGPTLLYASKTSNLTVLYDGVNPSNVTIVGNYLFNSTAISFNGGVNVTYGYVAIPASGMNAYNAVNGTENSGYTIVNYLPLIFLAVIFGALMTLVLKIILPYINLGQQTGGF
jgi:hypothetical protein